jgi:hypothetical protein
MFTGGKLSRLMARPLLIAGGLIVTVLVIALPLTPWDTLERLSLRNSDTCGQISVAGKNALDTMLPEAERVFQEALSTPNLDTYVLLCGTPRRSE